MMLEGGARREVSLWSFVLLRGPLCNSCSIKENIRNGGKMEGISAKEQLFSLHHFDPMKWDQ